MSSIEERSENWKILSNVLPFVCASGRRFFAPKKSRYWWGNESGKASFLNVTLSSGFWDSESEEYNGDLSEKRIKFWADGWRPQERRPEV